MTHSPCKTNIIHIKVEYDSDVGKRLDVFLSKNIDNLSRTKIKESIITGKVSNIINEKCIDPSYGVKKNEEFYVKYVYKEYIIDISKIDIPVVYEDNDIFIINKPANIVVHPGIGTQNDTLVDILLNTAGRKSLSKQHNRPGIVHRLDKDTTGLLIIAKNEIVHAKLSQMFAEHNIKRYYIAVVNGIPKENHGQIKTKIAPSRRQKNAMSISYNRGVEAITNFNIVGISSKKMASILELSLETGRTHQIRLHMQYNNTPIIGDKLYNNTNNYHDLIQRQALHAYKIDFIHPITNKKICITTKLPTDLQNLIRNIDISCKLI